MPLPSLSAALQHKQPDIEKTALYPRQPKSERKEDEEEAKKPKKVIPGLFDLLKADANSGESKMVASSAFAAALSGPEKPANSMGDMLSYWQNVTKASRAQQQTVGYRLNTVLKSVNMEGFKQASRATTWRAKIFWICMLLFIIGVLSFEIWKCVKDYQNSPVTTKFTISTPQTMDFPKVYICYGSAINHTYMQMHKDLMTVAIAYRNRDAVTSKKGQQRPKRDQAAALDLTDEEIAAILRMQADQTARDDPFEVDDGFDGLDMAEMEDQSRLKRDVVMAPGVNRSNIDALNAALEANRTKAEAQARVKALLQSPNISDIIYQYYQDAGFKIDETFLECTFHGYKKQKLDCRDIVRPVVDANYFLCYVVDLPHEMKQTVAGKGLSLILNSHINLYPKAAEEKPPVYGGLVVSVDKEYNPFNWEKTCVTPGRLTKMDLSLTHVHLENLESGSLIQHCLNDDQADGIFQIFKANYSRTTCQMDCLFQSHRNYCNCMMLVDRSQLKPEVLKTTGFCTPKQFSECVGSLPENDEAQRAVNACLAHCHPPCESYRYDMRSSYAKLHEPSYSHIQLPPNVTAKQLVDLRVAFSRLEYAALIQAPSASFADLVANLGGQINLWMGASLISMFEMLFMAFGLLIWTCYMKVVKRRDGGEKEIGKGAQNGQVKKI